MMEQWGMEDVFFASLLRSSLSCNIVVLIQDCLYIFAPSLHAAGGRYLYMNCYQTQSLETL